MLKGYQKNLHWGQKIGIDKYTVCSDILYKDIWSDYAAEPQYLIVPTNSAETYKLVHHLHTNMGHLWVNTVSNALYFQAWVSYSQKIIEEVVRTYNKCQFIKQNSTISHPLHLFSAMIQAKSEPLTSLGLSLKLSEEVNTLLQQ